MIEKLPQKEFEKLFIELHKKIIEDPIKNFVEAPGFMDTELTPGQTVLFKLVCGKELESKIKQKSYLETKIEDDFSLEEVELTEVELYEKFTGKTYDPNGTSVINDITLIVGRRGGKTLASSILAIYSALKMNWKPLLGKHSTATILVVSHTKEFSDEIIDVIRGLIEESPILSRLIDTSKKNTQSTINLKVPFLGDNNKITYSRVRIRTNAASSKSSRGSACPVILADEIGFWGSDSSAKETDEEIVRAITPSMLQFSGYNLFVKLSSPNIKQGVLYKLYEKQKELPDNFIVLNAPSWEFNNRLPAKEFSNEYKLDSDNFDREFRANFTDSISMFIIPEFVDSCVINNAKFLPPEDDREDIQYFAAIDAAYKGDTFTFCVVGHQENRVKQYVMKGWEGSRANPVSAHTVAQYIRNICKQYKIAKVFADQYSFQPLREIFQQYGVVLEENPFNVTFKKKIYFNLKRLIHNNQIDLLDNHQLVRELKELIVEQTPTGMVRISHPPGGHDDHADALAIASYAATEKTGSMGFQVVDASGIKDYGIKTDHKGRTFTAPAPEQLQDTYKTTIIDNSDQYEIDPETGRLRPVDDDDDLDGSGFMI